MLHKVSRVEFHPLGVIGAIVPWNYPFHNIFNPMLAAVFSGNAIVIKVYHYNPLTLFYVIFIFAQTMPFIKSQLAYMLLLI